MQSIIHFFTILVFCVPHYHFIALIQHALINESWKQKVKCLSSDTEDHILIHSDICVLSWSGKWIVAPVAFIGRLSSVQLNSCQWNRKLVFRTTTLLISCSRPNRQQWNRQQWNRQQWRDSSETDSIRTDNSRRDISKTEKSPHCLRSNNSGAGDPMSTSAKS